VCGAFGFALSIMIGTADFSPAGFQTGIFSIVCRDSLRQFFIGAVPLSVRFSGCSLRQHWC
jgi:hypothetical protein